MSNSPRLKQVGLTETTKWPVLWNYLAYTVAMSHELKQLYRNFETKF